MLFSYLCLIAFVLQVLMSGSVFKESPRSALNRLFSLSILAFAASSLSYAVIYSPVASAQQIAFWLKISVVGWTVGIPVFTHFSMVLTDFRYAKSPVFLTLLYTPGFVLTLTAWFIFPSELVLPFNLFFLVKELSVFFFISYILYQIVCLFFIFLPLIFSWGFLRKSQTQRVQAKIILSSFFICFSAGYLWDFLSKHFGLPEMTITPVIFLIWTSIVWSTVRRYHLMELAPTSVAEKIVDNMMDIMMLLDRDGRIFRINQQLKKMSGYSADDLLGHRASDFFKDEQEENENLVDFILLHPEQKIFNRFALITRDGRVIPLRISIIEVTSSLGSGGGFGLLGQDLRPVRKLERANKHLVEVYREAESSNQNLERFAYIASHDLREPLRSIGSFTSLLKRDLGEDLEKKPHLKEYLDYIITGITRMNGLIEGLLEYSRVKNSNQPLREIDLDSVIHRAKENLRALIGESKMEIQSEPLPKVMGDNMQIERVFQNLIQNAIKYKKSGVTPKVYIGSYLMDNTAVIYVEDNGIGIPQEYLSQIFSLFRRLHSDAEIEGVGIGLSVCKRIVERHGGNMWAESIEGQGSRFYFSLPLAQPIE